MKKMVFTVTTELEQSLPYYVNGVGIDYDQEPICRPEGYPFYQWIQTRRGAGHLVTEGAAFTVGEGQGMLLFPQIPHQYEAQSGQWDVDWIIFEGRGVGDFFAHCDRLQHQGVYPVYQPRAIIEKLEQIYENEHSVRAARSLDSARLTYGVLLDLLQCVSGRSDAALSQEYVRLRPVLALIEAEACCGEISLSRLARAADVTPQYLCTLFKKAMGLTLTEFINRTRIRKSKALLTMNPGVQVKAVAAQCGFSDVSYFCAMFRRLEGMSPGEFHRLYT